MKKILLISLFGLSARCLDVHLYALDTSFVKKTELKKIESEYQQAEKYDGDLSVAQAEKICADYESWAEKNNTKHAYITDFFRKYFGRNSAFFSVGIPIVLLGAFVDLALLKIDFEVEAKEFTKSLALAYVLYLVAQKIEFMRRCKCLLTDQEEAKIQAALQKYGYSEAQACELSKKMFIMHDNVDCDGFYNPTLDRIGLKEYVFKYHDATFSHILLHELEHYKHSIGHIFCDPQSFFFSPKEEQRADTEAMKKLQKYNQENVLTNLGMGFGNYTHLLNKGYLAHSPAVRNCIAYKVQKQKIEAQFM